MENLQKKLKKTDWLSAYKQNITSQFGEDGIIEKIFTIIKDGNRWCVEFGALDGKLFSNTWNLIQNKGWSGILIEADTERYKELFQEYKNNSKVVLINKYVNFKGANTLDNILSKTLIPKSLDLLVIDIDGNDYHMWELIKVYRPKVVTIEFNPSIPIDVEFMQPKDMRLNQGSSLLSLCMLAKRKDYELVAITDVNAFFVDKKYFKLFEIWDNSLPLMNKNKEWETQLFQLYDGTLVLSGYKKLIWHGIKLNQEKMQVLPAFLREFPGLSKRSLAYRLLLLYYKEKSLKVVLIRIVKSIIQCIKFHVKSFFQKFFEHNL